MTLLTVLIALLAFATGANAQDAIKITSNKFTNKFPKQLLFQLETQSSAKITEIALIVQLDGQASSSRQLPEFTSDTRVQTTYEWDLNRAYLPPGVTGQFWWTIEDSAGNQKQSDKQSFRVDDPSQQWKKLANDKLALYWYRGDDNFGKALFDRGVQAMGFLQQDTGVAVDRQIQVFIYGNRTDFFNALEQGAKDWTGGRAFPDYSIILINVEPSSLEWGKDATVHELTHQVIHQKISGPLGDISMPRWLDEGLAMYYETIPGTLDSQFANPLRRAIQNDTLIALRTLAGAFPTDAAAANLSYAESYSVVDFIFRHYGREKMAQLLQAFKKGGYYDDVLRAVLSVETEGLEAEWRKDIGAKPRAVVTRAVTTPTAFPTFSLSTDYTPAPTTVKPTAVANPTATPPAVAVAATPVPPPPTVAPRAPSNPISQLCGGTFGLIALGIFGALWQWRRM
jgi:hypothetical protein